MQSAIQSIINLIHRAQLSKTKASLASQFTFASLPPLPKKESSLTDYRIHTSLGEGGFGKIYLATHLPTNNSYALKRISLSKISAKRFTFLEGMGWIPVEVWALIHATGVPGVIAFIEMLRVGQEIVIVQEVFGSVWNPHIPLLVTDALFYQNALNNLTNDSNPEPRTQSMDLFEFLSTHTLTSSQIKQILLQLIHTIIQLGDRGIIHGDIKDENILIDTSLSIRLIDFGGAAIDKLYKSGDKRVRLNAKDFHGTMEFAAPEVLRGEWYDSEKAEMWAVGCLVFGMCFGRLAFADKQASLEKDAFEGGLGVGKDGEVRCGDVELIAFMRRCFEKEEDNRMGFIEMGAFVFSV